MRDLFLAIAIVLLVALPASLAHAQNAPAIDSNMCAVPAVPSADVALSKKDQQKALAQVAVARNAYLKRDFPTSIAALQAAYALDPLVDILYNIAQACREAGLEQEALLLYQRVLEQNPLPEQRDASKSKLEELRARLAAAGSTLASQQLDNKRYEEAAAGFKRAYELSPQPDYLFQLGEALRLAGKNSQAVAAYQRLLNEAPQSPNANTARRQLSSLKGQLADEAATLHYGKGEYAAAILSWDAAYKEDPRPIFLFRQAEAMRQTKQTMNATAEYKRFLRESPESEQPELRQQAQTRLKELSKLPQTPFNSEARPIYKRWWFWTAIVGGAALATGLAVGLTAQPKMLTAPDGVMVLQTAF